LADLGAEVIKVEPPAGEITRTYGPFPGDKKEADKSALFLYLNAGKKGVSLDLSTREGKESFKQIIRSADILVENTLTSKELEEGGLGFPELARINPGLIMVSITPFGRTGPYKDYRGYDINCSAFSALSMTLGSPDREPLVIPYDQCDFQAAWHGASAALTALLARRKTGRGQFVDISTSEVMIYCVRGMYLVTRWGGWKRKGARQLVSVYPTGYFECKDGYACIATQTAKQWRKFIALMGEPEWSKDPFMRDALSLGVQNPDAGDAVLKPWLKQFTRAELMKMARENGITMGTVNRIDEMVQEPHLVERKFWAEVNDPRAGKVKLPGLSYQMSATPWRMDNSSPRLGEHNQEILNGKNPAAPAQKEGKKLKRPLEGYRVLDFGWNWAGPLAAQILADMGAEVIKIESSTRQDVTRFLDYVKHFFRHNNRSKLSVTVDLKQPGGVELVKRLARISDIVLDNFSAGVMERNGLSYEALREVKPDIICISMSMAGQKGPLKDMKGFASIASSFGGLEGLVGYEDTGSIGIMSFGLGDVNIGIQGTFAVLAALYHREQTGEGQFLDVSQIEAIVSLMGEPVLDYFLNQRVPGPRENFHPHLAPHGLYPTKGEDQWVSIAVGTEEEWRKFCRAIGEPAWTREKRFADLESRLKNTKALDKLIGEWTRNYTHYEATGILQKAGVAAAPLLGIEEGEQDAHVRFRGVSQMMEYPGEDPEKTYLTPWRLSDTPGGLDRLTPRLGEHNEYVFKDLLKMSEEEYKRMVEEKIIL
ncbi:MAG: CoA transferase, partial [Proteobacteria bacterium]|nr:CoA transferase [Pseudomonadota bacterium]